MKSTWLPIAIICSVLFTACEKWTDPEPKTDPRIGERRYCNDPEAVNFNWNFPGLEDNTTCIYPSDLFKGTYLFRDSIYSADNVFDSARSGISYILQIIPSGKSKFRVLGFCGPGDSLLFTAERSTYRASADTTIIVNDSTFGYGQFFCRDLDTLTGSFTKSRTDSTALLIDFRVISDTGANLHRGTAIRQ